MFFALNNNAKYIHILNLSNNNWQALYMDLSSPTAN